MVVSDPFGSETNEPAVLTVLEPPVLVQQPESQTVASGQTVSFLVSATGHEPLRYQWRRNGRFLAGQTNAALTLLNVQSGDAGNYRAAVSHITGAGAVGMLSSNAVLTVTP